MGNDKVSHCFPLNGEDDPNIVGIENIIATYRNNLPSIELPNSPAQLSPVLEQFEKYVKEEMVGNNGYGILLLLTGGAITDLEDAKDVLVKMSALPCSVIIVGLGGKGVNKALIELDGDDYAVSNKQGTQVERDIVQYVSLNDAMKNGNLEDQVLKEIPFQTCSYMWKVGSTAVQGEDEANESKYEENKI